MAWLRSADGLALRGVAWGEGAPRGVVLLLQGRTEYAEKYARVAADLGAAGWATATLDWRGQGLSERLWPDRALGHVRRFADYQWDVDALAGWAGRLAPGAPRVLLAHSMGGAVGLRALMGGLEVGAAAFSAPMWGLRMGAFQRPYAWAVGELGRRLGLGGRMTPGQEARTYLLRQAFEGNTLTGDRETWEWMRAQAEALPDAVLGGPSLLWLSEALRETRRLARLASPRVQAVALLGTQEEVVDPAPVRERMARWPGGRLVVLEGARHEVLMERAELRGRALEEVAGAFGGA